MKDPHCFLLAKLDGKISSLYNIVLSHDHLVVVCQMVQSAATTERFVLNISPMSLCFV